MPYKTLPDEATARAAIEVTLKAISPGVLPPGTHKQVVLGGLFVEFHGHKTRTSWLVHAGGYVLVRGTLRSGPSGDVLRIGKAFARGQWETALGVQMVWYSSDSGDPLPQGMINEVRDVVDGRRSARMALGHLQQAMDALGELVECVQERMEGVPDMIQFVCRWSDPRFLVALAIVLRFAGARSSDVQLILDMVGPKGGDVSAILSEILGTADRIQKFEQLLAISPSEQQLHLVRHAVETNQHLLGWLGFRLQDAASAREFYDRITTAFEREGLALIRVKKKQPMSGSIP